MDIRTYVNMYYWEVKMKNDVNGKDNVYQTSFRLLIWFSYEYFFLLAMAGRVGLVDRKWEKQNHGKKRSDPTCTLSEQVFFVLNRIRKANAEWVWGEEKNDT